MSVIPSDKAITQWTVNRLVADITAEIPACRAAWWANRRTTCLVNRWVLVQDSGTVMLSHGLVIGAKQVADAVYELDHETLGITFLDGTTMDVSTKA